LRHWCCIDKAKVCGTRGRIEGARRNFVNEPVQAEFLSIDNDGFAGAD
jgi:hypothetical protein